MFYSLEENLSCQSSFSNALDKFENNMLERYKNLVKAVNITKIPLKNENLNQNKKISFIDCKEKNDENCNVKENNIKNSNGKKHLNKKDKYTQLKNDYSKFILKISELEKNNELLKNFSLKSIKNSENYEKLYVKLEKRSSDKIMSLKEIISKNEKTIIEKDKINEENQNQITLYKSKIESYEKLLEKKENEIIETKTNEKKERKLSIEICNTFNYEGKDNIIERTNTLLIPNTITLCAIDDDKIFNCIKY